MGKNQFKIEYLEEFNKIKHSYEYWLDDRNKLVEKYSWAIPNHEALIVLQRYSPILEIGAGKGYWAYLMRKNETAVQAFDLKSSENTPGSWSMVLEINENTFNYTHGHTLFLCWPPYENPMAYDAITKFEGENVIYIGEGYEGYTADEKFHDYLFDNFVQVDEVKIPQWWGIYDDMTVWQRLEE